MKWNATMAKCLSPPLYRAEAFDKTIPVMAWKGGMQLVLPEQELANSRHGPDLVHACLYKPFKLRRVFTFLDS